MDFHARSSRRHSAVLNRRPAVIVERLETRELLTLAVANVLTSTGKPPVEGSPFSNVKVATFNLGDVPGSVASDFIATINWGDGGPITSGIITQVNGGFVISGNYNYRTAPPTATPFIITVTLQGSGGGPISASGPVIVSPAALASTGLSFATGKGAPFAGIVAGFTDADTLLTTDDFTASINWGDGTISSGLISAASSGIPGSFSVQGQTPHAYSVSGNYTVVTTISHANQSTVASSTGTVTSSPPVITTTGQFLTAVANTPIGPDTVVGTFVYHGNNAGPVFTAAINWGDGQVTVGNVIPIVGSSPAAFNVQGGNTYHAPGNFVAGITVQDQFGESATITSAVTVVGPVLSVLGGTTLAVTPGSPIKDAKLGTFTDSNPLANATNISAVIHWGDGQVSNGTIVGPDAKGVYTVTGGTTYANGPGPFTITVNLTDPSDFTGTVTSHAKVSIPTLTARPVNITATPGIAFTTAVATFTDSNPLAAGSNPVALISWGDGFSTQGTVSGPDANGLYTVKGTYSYFNPSPSADGRYHLSVTITDASGLTATVHPSAYVPAPVLPPATFTGGLATGGVDSQTNRPTFSGTANPFALVRLFATMVGIDANPTLGQTIAGADGRWSLLTGPLAQGVYTVTAVVTPPGSSPSAPFEVGPTGQILIDTNPPKVVGVSAKAGRGQVYVVFRDDLSGMSIQGLSNPAAYTLFGPRSQPIHPTAAQPLPNGGLATDTQTVLLTIPGSPKTRRNLRSLRIAAAAITDNAGNAVATDFNGPLASLSYGRAGSNFVYKFGSRGPRGPRH